MLTNLQNVDSRFGWMNSKTSSIDSGVGSINEKVIWINISVDELQSDVTDVKSY